MGSPALSFGGSTVGCDQAVAPRKECRGKRIEWTGAGGDYFLAVIVDDRDEIISERWGTRNEIVKWIETQWPQLPAKFVPMALSASRRQVERRTTPRVARRKALGYKKRAGKPQ
jgi:hypothetical protein